MVPDIQMIHTLWKRYDFPSQKRIHCDAVAKVALILAQNVNAVIPAKAGMTKRQKVNEQLLYAAALLHDIDKNIEKLPGESHPDAAVRVLKKEGMEEVAEVIRTHPLHTIFDANQSPQTIEQKILFLSDKMVRYEYIGVEERFALWQKEDDDEESRAILEASYPKVIALRDEILGCAGITEKDLVKLV